MEMQMARYSVKPSYLFPRPQSPVSNLTPITLLFTFLFFASLPSHFPLHSQRSFKNVPFHLSLCAPAAQPPFHPRSVLSPWAKLHVTNGSFPASEMWRLRSSGKKKPWPEESRAIWKGLNPSCCLFAQKQNNMLCYNQCQTRTVTKLLIIFRWKTVQQQIQKWIRVSPKHAGYYRRCYPELGFFTWALACQPPQYQAQVAGVTHGWFGLALKLEYIKVLQKKPLKTLQNISPLCRSDLHAARPHAAAAHPMHLIWFYY